jgi:large subunit ribosomal protein L5
MPRLKDSYKAEIIPAMMQKFEYKNVNQVPRLEKVVINMGMGDAKDNPKALESGMQDLTVKAGQKPIGHPQKNPSQTSGARRHEEIGREVTHRGTRKYEFLDK